MTPPIRHLVTHSGEFHADDACAAAILIGLYPRAVVVRTRDTALIDHLSETGIVFDVGLSYDAAARRFDHHQPDAPQRPDGTRYSAVGLVWQHYGRQWLASLGTEWEAIEKIWKVMDREMILPIDLVDNGHVSPGSLGVAQRMTLLTIVSSMNPVFDEDPGLADTRFDDAVQMMTTALESRARSLGASLRAEGLVASEVAAQWGDPVLVLPRKMPFHAAVRKTAAEHILFIVSPSPSGGWGIEGMAVEDNSYQLRRDLPEAWAGLTGPDLEKASGVPGARFCHRGRFFAVGETKEAAVAMARLAMIDDPSPCPAP